MKQVIIIRKDLNMRKGKMIAQGAHASNKVYERYRSVFTNQFYDWKQTGSTKIVLSVNSEQELLDIYAKAGLKGMPSAIIRDEGRTEFKEPTLTAVAIGPWLDAEIDQITGKLDLL